MLSNVGRLLLCFVGAISVAASTPSLSQLAASPERWPAEVTVIASARAIVLNQGQPAGPMLVGAGRTLALTAVDAEGVVGKLGGATVRLPADKTDLWQRIGALPPAAAVPVAATPAPTVTAVATQASAPPAPAPRPTAAGRPTVPATPVETALAGKLVHVQAGRVVPFDTARLNGVKFYGIYFSASWCGPCKQFTPELVRDYEAIRALYPEFEIVLVSWDRSEADMHAYLRDDKMPWPALRWADRNLGLLRQHAGRGIPCLVLIDGNGKELSHSYRRGQYVGPDRVIEDTWKILKEARRKASQ